jgi:hypothetical protein
VSAGLLVFADVTCQQAFLEHANIKLSAWVECATIPTAKHHHMILDLIAKIAANGSL